MIDIEMAAVSDIEVIAGFQVAMASETENMNLDYETVIRGVTQVFNDPAKGFYLVAKEEAKTIGCLMITYEWSDWRSCTVWWIQSLYVLPGWRRKGIFRLMYEWLLAEITHRPDIGGIRLYVDRTNVDAQRVYESLGMDGNHYRFYEWMKG